MKGAQTGAAGRGSGLMFAAKGGEQHLHRGTHSLPPSSVRLIRVEASLLPANPTDLKELRGEVDAQLSYSSAPHGCLGES